MKLILLILLSCGLATCSIAQDKDNVLKQPISYIQKVPAFATKLLPAQGKSLFWGKLTDKDTKGFHLYSLYAPELKRKQPMSNYLQCHFALDIFALDPKPKLINRIFLVFKGGWAPTTYGMFFTWMKPKGTFMHSQKNTIPMIVVKSFAKGIYGPDGIEHFIVFNNGWLNQASVSNLRFGGWRGSYTAGEDNELVIGRNGLIEIHASLSPTTNEFTPEQYARDYTFSLRWDSIWDIIAGKYVPHAENEKVIETYFDPYQ